MTRSAARNVILILADDMGYGDFGFANPDAGCTPSLDEIAATSRIYSQHTSASPACAPARAALLTGRYAQRTGVIDTLEARGTDRLARGEVTVADVLRRQGVATGLVGKWHTGAIGAEYHPLRRGFDEFVGFRGGWQDYWDWNLERNGARVAADGRYLTDVLGAEAVDFVRRHRDQPFFLHVAFNAPHFPYQAPGALIARHRRPDRTERVATVYAMIEAMDAAIGRLREAVDDCGLAEDTLFLVTSDNGPELGGVGDESAARPNHGLAGAKQHVLEGGIRVPLLAHQPGVVRAGDDHSFVHGVDLAPTILGHLGVDHPAPKPLDGRDLGATLDGGEVSDIPRFWQWTRYAPQLGTNAAVRDGRWKLVRPAVEELLGLDQRDELIDHDIKRHPERYRDVDDPPVLIHPVDTEPMLFDLEQDPGEQIDVSAENPFVRARLLDALADWYDEVERERRLIGALR